MSTHALVLAGGEGRRFGRGKLVGNYLGQPLVSWAATTALATRVDLVSVVLGAESAAVADVLRPLHCSRLRTINCARWQEGLSATLRCGLDSLPADTMAVLIFLGDMPHVSSALADRLLATVLGGAPAALAGYRGQPAHPAALAACLIPQLRGLTGDRGARAFLKQVPAVVRVETDEPGSIFDVDTPGELSAFEALADEDLNIRARAS
jgi:molybdenum cofactor cytidylyltransferase